MYKYQLRRGLSVLGLVMLFLAAGCSGPVLETKVDKNAGSQRAVESVTNPAAVVSYVDIRPDKEVLMVDGAPFFYNGIQSSPHRLMDKYGWTWKDMDQVFAATVDDGFTVAAVPIRWLRIEPTVSTMDWTDIDASIDLSNKYGLKLEILWFGSDVCGNGTEGAPAWARSMFVPFSKTNQALLDKEKTVVQALMNHVKAYQESKNYGHIVVGIQLLNEPAGDIPTLWSYLNGLAQAVKTSSYSVWTRCNAYLTSGLVKVNEDARASTGTYLDFLGDDWYTEDWNNMYRDVTSDVWNYGHNLASIAETGGQTPYADRSIFNAYAGNGTSHIFEVNDSMPNLPLGLYTTDLVSRTMTPRAHQTNVRNLNMLFQKDKVDLATMSPLRQRVKFYNKEFASSSNYSQTVGANTVRYNNLGGSGAGIAIARDDGTYVFMSTSQAVFAVPSGLSVLALEAGYYNGQNSWVAQSNVALTTAGSEKTFTIDAYTCVRMTYTGGATFRQNLALGATAIMSGPVGWGHSASYAVDGSTSTIAQSSNQLWDLTVDLGSAESISSVVFRPDSGSYARDYSVSVSVDNSTWVPVGSVTNATSADRTYSFAATTARYVRFQVTAVGHTGLWGHAVREVEVYAALPNETPTNLARGAIATMSGVVGWNHPGSAALDGNVSTIAQCTTPLWDLTVNLGAGQRLGRIVFTPDSTSWAKDFLVQVSLDNQNWTTVGSAVGASPTPTTFAFPSVLAQYTRLVVTAVGHTGNWGHAVRELEVYTN